LGGRRRPTLLLNQTIMPIKHASIKDLKKIKKHTVFNLQRKNLIKFLKKQIIKAKAVKDESRLKELFTKYQQAVDKAVKQHILKKNTAGRYKSRLAKFLKK